MVSDPQRLFARLISIFCVIRDVLTAPTASNFVVCKDKGVMSQKAELRSRGTRGTKMNMYSYKYG